MLLTSLAACPTYRQLTTPLNNQVSICVHVTNIHIHCTCITASQMWCLARLLPLIIGDLIPENDNYWLNFLLLLLKITGLIFSPLSSRNIAAYLTSLIEDYLSTFTELYPHCPIIPKQHMIHIPKWIVR